MAIAKNYFTTDLDFKVEPKPRGRIIPAMNKFLVRLVLVRLLFGVAAIAGAADETKTNAVPEVKAASAKENVGKEALVSGTVVEISKAQGLVRLNFEKAFPNQSFTAVIFARNTNAFGDLENLKGKKVEVSGKITEYRGRAQIIMTSTNQLRVAAAEPDKKN
jgi:DNA/RNA endonuclease YhcR with UshA esterase domain